jgi:CheY-like chemotaxis protein
MDLKDAAAKAPRRALVVDDDGVSRQMLADSLRARGLSVVEAEGAEAALQILSEGGPVDLVVTDLWMPGIHGEQLVRAVRKLDPAGAGTLVIVVTGDVTSRLELELHQAGADAVLSKRLGSQLIAAAANMLVTATAPAAALGKQIPA